MVIDKKNETIANRSRVICAHNTSRAFYRPKYYTVTLKSKLRVTQGHWDGTIGQIIHDLLFISRVL